MPSSSALVVGQFELFPELGVLDEFVERRDWQAIESALEPETDPDVLIPAMSVVIGSKGAENFLLDAVARQPQSALANTFLAQCQVELAWEVRSAKSGEYVSQEQFREFHALLRKAEARLIEVCARTPDFTVAWYARLGTAIGLELGMSEARRRYDRLARYHPRSTYAQGLLLQRLCPKWDGSWEAAFEFARACTAAAPPGSTVPSLMAEVYFELYVELGGKEGRQRLADPAVREELIRAADASVFHPDFRRGYDWVNAHSVFAIVHCMAGDHAAAARHFTALGDSASLHFWGYLGDGEALFRKHREIALGKG